MPGVERTPAHAAEHTPAGAGALGETAPGVRAAGGVLWRPAPTGPQVCVVHRARYDDWSLPKGKLHADEHPLAAAVREIREETGVPARPQLRLPSVSYVLPGGVPKSVQYWLLQAGDGPVARHDDEVDEVAWLSPAAAAGRVSYPGDRRLLDHVARLPPVTAVLPLVRHGRAGKRGAFAGDDSARPLDARGVAQATALAPLLALFEPQQVYSATPRRCVQTVQPVADRLDLPIFLDPVFDEPRLGADALACAARAAARLRELRDDARTVVCSQGKLIPPLLALLSDADDLDRFATPKGTGWLLSFAGDRLIGLERLAGE
ncbi:MAG TPA: NUDIX domain-containing protein [Actinoplanes sp.]|nr:NUDIX domain-containing protein [Actinoplanes sp.]